MTSILERQLKSKIAKAFKGKLLKGTLRRITAAGLDAYGDPTSPTVQNVAFEGVRDTFSAYYKAQAGIPDTDVSILIILGSMNPALTPNQDDKVYVSTPWNKWYQVRKVLSIDTAGAVAQLQAFEIPDPA